MVAVGLIFPENIQTPKKNGLLEINSGAKVQEVVWQEQY